MFLTRRTMVAFLVLTAAVAAGGQEGGTGLSVAEFEKLHRELQPPKDELWRSIPWQVSILEGREQAAREKKPLFVWVASGEPLGCG
ncbi:MAG TPA: hypothetical protein VKD72_05750 [Gemmataceae bacterium]|nr:hypothetical protein [Gemmataceae bacterium]